MEVNDYKAETNNILMKLYTKAEDTQECVEVDHHASTWPPWHNVTDDIRQ